MNDFDLRAETSVAVIATAAVALVLTWLFSKDLPKRAPKKRYKKPDVAA